MQSRTRLSLATRSASTSLAYAIVCLSLVACGESSQALHAQPERTLLRVEIPSDAGTAYVSGRGFT